MKYQIQHIQMEIIDNVFKEKMDEFNKENELGLTDYECSCYANCFSIK